MKTIKVKDAKPCGYNVIVELHPLYDLSNGEAKTEGGIIIGSMNAKREQDTVQCGKVVSIGKYAHKALSCGADGHEDWGYKVGDWVTFSRHCGQPVGSDPADLRRILTDHEIKAVVDIEIVED